MFKIFVENFKLIPVFKSTLKNQLLRERKKEIINTSTM